jgi:hypothetical protein
LEVTAVEYFANETEDDLEKGIVGGLIVEKIDSDSKDSFIKGEGFIKPKITYEYEFIGDDIGEWSVDKKDVVLDINNKKVNLKWNSNYSGSFELKYGDFLKTIVVESLF